MMTTSTLPNDEPALEVLRKQPQATIAQISRKLGVTATAVRQRLTRLMAAGLVDRDTVRHGRGRPVHLYKLTPRGRARQGSNFADLAGALWREIANVEPSEIRLPLLRRVLTRLSEQYRDELDGETLPEKLAGLRGLLRERGIAFDLDPSEALPILSTSQCPYPGLADDDPSICEWEREMFSKIVGQPLALSQCRAHGDACCQFVPQSSPVSTTERQPT